jgi:hypothetical protein
VGKTRDRKGRARQLARSTRPVDEAIDELFLSTLSRFPTADERALIGQTYSDLANQRERAFEDILWALLNSKEFIYNH